MSILNFYLKVLDINAKTIGWLDKDNQLTKDREDANGFYSREDAQTVADFVNWTSDNWFVIVAGY